MPFLTEVPDCRDEKSQLLLGVRRATRQQTMLSSSVLSTDSMHIGVLAAAAHAASSGSSFTIYYNPRYRNLLTLLHMLFFFLVSIWSFMESP